MDWKYKHFKEMAIYSATQQSVLDAARSVVAESLGGIEDTPEGFVAHGYGGWHASQATVHINPVAEGTQVLIELLVERATMRGYMLVDIGGYYTGQMDKWFAEIGRQLGDSQSQSLVRKTTANIKNRQGCLAGCLVYFLVGVCLSILAIPLDHALFPQFPDSSPGPFGMAASLIGIFAGVIAFIYIRYPDASVARFIRVRLPGTRK